MISRTGKTYLISIIIILLFISLNPTYLNFKEFTGITGKDTKFLHKKNNFLFFSIYIDELNDKKYLGIVKNFIDISPSHILLKKDEIDSTTTVAKDSVVLEDSSKVDTRSETIIRKPIDSITEWDYRGEIPDTIHVSEDASAKKALRYLRKCYDLYLNDNSDLHPSISFPLFVDNLKFPKIRKKMFDNLVIKNDLGSFRQFEDKIGPYYSHL